MVCHPVLFEHPKSVSGASIGFKDNFLILHTQVAFSFGMCVVLLLYWPGTFQVFAPPLVAAHLFLYHFDLLDDFGSDFTFGAGVFGAFSFSRSFWRFLSIALIWFRNGLSHMLLVSTMFPTSGHNVYIYIHAYITLTWGLKVWTRPTKFLTALAWSGSKLQRTSVWPRLSGQMESGSGRGKRTRNLP